MKDNGRLSQLVQQAQAGDRLSQERLSTDVRDMLINYVGYFHLDPHVREDIVQEILLSMISNLKQLKDTHKFTPWLLQITSSIVNNHHRRHKNHNAISLSSLSQEQLATMTDTPDNLLADLIANEFRQATLECITRLPCRYKEVIFLRCYQHLDYTDIGQIMKCSKFSAQTLFWRAKKAVQKQLAKKGFRKCLLPMALIFYGKLTSTSLAAAQQVTVTPAMLKVGLIPALVGSLGTKSGMMTSAAVGILGVGAAMMPVLKNTSIFNSSSSHNPAAVVMPASQDKDNNSQLWWYYYPKGKAGPVWVKRWLSGEVEQGSYWLQNDQGNYFYNECKNIVSLVNPRIWHSDLSVMRLHTDSSKLTSLLDDMEGKSSEIQYLNRPSKGTWIKDRYEGDHYSSVYEEREYDPVMDSYYFIPSAPSKARRQDLRDEMHKRGWTYFRVKGYINDKEISGKGRLPFVMDAYKENYPWLRISAGGCDFVDGPQGALLNPGKGISNPSARTPDLHTNRSTHDMTASMSGPGVGAALKYTPGSFFNAICKPWLGLHTIDTIRREAARKRIPFETRRACHNTVEIELDGDLCKLIYTINLEKDIPERVIWQDRQGRFMGEMLFTFLQEFANIEDEFSEPHPSETGPVTRGGETLWLMELAHVSMEQEREFR